MELDQTTEVTEPTQPEQTEHQYSDAEKEAMSQGWTPNKDEFEKNNPGKKWRPAEDFIERGELLSKIHAVNRKSQDLETTVTKLSEQNQQLLSLLKDLREKELRTKQQEAAAVGDTEATNKITDEILKLQEQFKPVETKPSVQSNLPQEINDFIARNSTWYNASGADNQAMTAYAIQRDNEYRVLYPAMTLADRLKMVENEVKTKFLKKENYMQDRPSPVGNSNPTSKKDINDFSYESLPSDIKRQYQSLKRVLGDKFDAKQYLKDLKDQGVI